MVLVVALMPFALVLGGLYFLYLQVARQRCLRRALSRSDCPACCDHPQAQQNGLDDALKSVKAKRDRAKSAKGPPIYPWIAMIATCGQPLRSARP